jgi:two-component system chemotaxis sensor kinase CheA
MGSSAATSSDRTQGRFLSISLKLAGTTVAVIAILAVGVYFALTRYERSSMMASKEAAASMVARLFVATAVAPLTFGDEKGVQDVVGLLAANNDIVYAAAWAVEEDGSHLGNRDGELRRGDAADPPAAIPAAMTVRRNATALVIESPVTDPSGKAVGVVQAVFSLAHEHEALQSIEHRILLSSCGASALLTALLLLLARRVIIKPVARLAGAAQALERGEETRVEITANDEIGKLATAFMSMSSAIEQREKRIAERNRDMRRVLDNVEDGFLAVTPEGVMSEERSGIIERWFGPPKAGATLFDYFGQMGGQKFGEWLRSAWDALADDFLPVDVAIEQFPARFDRDGRFYAIAYRPIMDGEKVNSMLVVIRDVTERVERERAEQMQHEMMVIFKHIINDQKGFDAFLRDAGGLVASIEHGDGLDDATLKRQIHTLKGNSAIFGLDSVARYCHELESRMIEESARPTAGQVAGLRSVWGAVAATVGKFSGGRGAQIVIDEDEQRELLRAIRSGAEARQIAAVVTSWRYERADARMNSIGEQVKQVAQRLEKGEVEVQVAPTKLRLPPQRWAPFWSVFGHVVRNAVDHGLEGPEKRAAAGKPERGVVRMAFEETETEVVFRFADDGAGIDWERLAAKASERGLPTATREDLEMALFADSVSTRDEASETSGRGVGMGAVLECVQAHSGVIEIETARGEGTTWVFRFPRAMLAGDDVMISRMPPAMSASRMTSRPPRDAKVA